MKTIREYRTKGDSFYCDVTFLPVSEDGDDLEQIIDIPCIVGTDKHLVMHFMTKYPKKVTRTSIFTRFGAVSHPNLSPLLVAAEISRFISLISKMYEL